MHVRVKARPVVHDILSSMTMQETVLHYDIPPLLPSMNKAKRIFLVVFGCVQNILGGGIIYGWAGISGSILSASREQGGAGLSTALIIHIFSISTSMGCFSQVPLGLINDKLGPRFCSILSNFIVGLGCFTFVFSQTWNRIMSNSKHSDNDDENTIFYTVGAILIAFGQPGVQLPLVHLGNLFPGHENSVISLITSSLSISFVIFPLFSSIWSRYHVDFRLLFRILGWAIWTLGLISFYLWPGSPFEKQTIGVGMVPVADVTNSDEGTTNKYECSWDTQDVTSNPTTPLDQQQVTNYRGIHNDLDFTTTTTTAQSPRSSSSSNSLLRDQLYSNKMARLTIYFVIAWFWGDMYVATLPVELKDLRYFDAETNNQLVQSFSYISSLGMFVSPLVGYSIDKVGSSYTCAATFALGVLQMIVLLSVPLFVTQNSSLAKWLLVVNFIMNNLFRTFLYPCFYSSLTEFFGVRHIGILSGTIVFIFGIAFLFLVPWGEFALGTCHLYNNYFNDEGNHEEKNFDAHGQCSPGKWPMLHIIQMISLAILVFDILLQENKEKHKESSYLDLQKIKFQKPTESDTVSDCSSLLLL
mmetsp:Transcript_2958/g.5536  ORF Transcript_2958/g.5536 Transcript_2958/m.5536 type:complete len:584 (+) Transcript_2958:93-1844(+)